MAKNTSQKRVIPLVFLLFVVVLALAAVFSFWATHRKTSPEMPQDKTPSEITSTIITELKLTDMTQVPENQLSKHYDYPNPLISRMSVYMSTSANSGNEIACFQLYDPNEFLQAEQWIARHIATKAQGFKELNPAEYEKIENYRVELHGNYILLVIDDSPETAVRLFHSILSYTSI